MSSSVFFVTFIQKTNFFLKETVEKDDQRGLSFSYREAVFKWMIIWWHEYTGSWGHKTGNAVLVRYYVPKLAVGVQMLPKKTKNKKQTRSGMWNTVFPVLTTEANLLFQLIYSSCLSLCTDKLSVGQTKCATEWCHFTLTQTDNREPSRMLMTPGWGAISEHKAFAFDFFVYQKLRSVFLGVFWDPASNQIEIQKGNYCHKCLLPVAHCISNYVSKQIHSWMRMDSK